MLWHPSQTAFSLYNCPSPPLLSCLFELCKEDDIFSRQPVIDMGKFLQVITSTKKNIKNQIIKIVCKVRELIQPDCHKSQSGLGEAWNPSNRQATCSLHRPSSSVHARGGKILKKTHLLKPSSQYHACQIRSFLEWSTHLRGVSYL